MKQSSLQQYWRSIKLLDEAQFHNYLIKQNIFFKQTNDTPTPHISQQPLNDNIIKATSTIVCQDKISLDRLCEFGMLMSQHTQQFFKLYKIMPPLPTAISLAVLRFMKNLNEKQNNLTHSAYNSLIEGIIVQEKILANSYAYQLFLGLVYGECLQNLKGQLKQLMLYFSKFIIRLELIEKYIKNDKIEIEVIRNLLEIGTYILTWSMNKPNSRDQIKNSIQNTQILTMSQDDIKRFCNVLSKYGMVDPQYKTILMRYITQTFEKNMENQFVVELFKVIVSLLNKRVFQGFDQFVFEQLTKIKKHVNHKNSTYFVKMVENLTDKKSKQFLKENQRYLLKFAFNEDMKILLFSLYYDVLCTNKNCDPPILNSLILWNVEMNLIPAQKFIPQLIKTGLQKISITTQLEIHNFKSPIGYQIIRKMVEKKCKQLNDSKIPSNNTLINYEFFNKNSDIYCIYNKVFIYFLTSIDEEKFAVSPPQTIAFLQTVDVIKHVREHVLNIFPKAVKNGIYTLKFLRSYALLTSLVQTIKPTELYSLDVSRYYFQAIKSLTQQQVVQLMNYYLWVFKIFKNAYCCFLISVCCLSISSNQKYKHHSENSLQLLFKYTQIQRFAKINSYSEQALKILLLLSYAPDEKIKAGTLKLLSVWSSLYNKTDIQIILFQFDKSLFQQFIQNSWIKFPNFSEQKFIFHTLQVLNQILKKPSQQKLLFMSHHHNCINFIPIRHTNQRNSLQINFKALINPKLCCNSVIQIYGSPRSESASLQKHRIIFKHGKIIFYNRLTKEVITTQQFPQELYYTVLQFTIQIANQKIVILINKREFLFKDYDFLVDSIRFDMYGDLMISQFRWKRFDGAQKKLDLNQSFLIFPNQVQIKIGKLAFHEVRSFQSKLNLMYFCLYLSELGRINYSKICFSQYYKICCQLIQNCESSTKEQFSSQQFACVRKLFKNLLKWKDTSYQIELPNLQKPSIRMQSKKFYQFLLATVINQRFLNQSSDLSKQHLLKYLQQLIFNKQSNFKQDVENKHVKLFGNISKMIIKLNGVLQQKYAQFIKKIILTHQTNQNLLKKISMIFYLSQSNNSKFLKQFFDKLLYIIFSTLGKEQNQQNYHIRLIAKFILSETKNLELVFLITNAQIKLKILDFMIENEQLSTRCHSIFQDLSESQLNQMSDWLIVFSKKLIFDFFDRKKQTKHNLLNLMFLLKQIAKIFDILNDPSQSHEVITILNDFITKSIKILNSNSNPQIISEINNFYSFPNLINVVARKIYKLNNQEIKDTNKQNFLHNYFNVLFMQMPKLILFEALEYFRKKIDNPYDCAFFMLKLQCILMLPEKSLSAFLQYLIQILFMVQQNEQQSRAEMMGEAVHQFLQKIIKNYPKVSQIKSPILYSFPKMQKKLDFNDPSLVKKIVADVNETKNYELKGGIYFKVLCIVFHLFQILTQTDLSGYIIFFLEKVCEKKENAAVYRAVNDFIQVRTATKNRSPMDMTIRQAQEEHLKYFQEYDEEFIPTKLLLRRSNSKIDIESDLTPYFVDYIFMRLCLYLQKNCNKNQHENNLNKLYSQLTIKYLKNYEHIWDEMNEKNIQSVINYQTVDDLTKLLQGDEYCTVSDIMNSPEAHYRRFSNEQEGQVSQNLGFIQFNKSGIDSQFLNTPSKSPRRRRTLIDLINGKKKLIQNIEQDFTAWSDEAKKKKIHRYFRDQSKQILFHQLLHQLYVVTSFSNSQTFGSKSKRFSLFLKDQQQLFNQQEKQIEKIWKNKSVEIRRVYPFTSASLPHLKLKCHSFPNGTFPFLSQMKHQKPIVQQQQQTQALSPELVSTLLNIPNEQQVNTPTQDRFDTIVCVADFENDELKDNFCQISFRKGVYFCEWQMNDKSIIFMSKSQKSATTKENQRIIKYGSPLSNILAVEGKKIQLKIIDILQIFYRKYNQIKNNSLEFFLKNGASVYVVFYTESRANKFLQKCKKKFIRFKQIKIVSNFIKSFHAQNYTQKWMTGQLSNFDYLMLINKYSGRTFCDLNQYYVFPWILQDYTSNYLDISNPKIYRDLRKPIGALNQDKLSKYIFNYENSKSYIYGSHYSTSLFIYYYLVRLEPFTTLHKDMQSGDFDAPDRLFSSMQQMWECLMSESSTSDIKQSIPQFYYFPAFLKNVNKLNLGCKQSGVAVQNVDLPPWAHQSATKFVQKMRICLQSDYVSSNLNYWIDLIFGKDQNSLQKNNIFHPLSYVESARPQTIDLQNLDAIISQITFFGQNPSILFTKQHPKKKYRLVSTNMPNNLSLYSSTDLSTISKQVTQKIAKVEQQNLQMIYYVSEMSFKTKNKVQLKIAGISNNTVTRIVDLDMDNTIHSLIRTIHKVETNSIKRLLSQNLIDIPEQKITVSTQVLQSEITFTIGVRQCSEIVKSIKLNYKFQKIRYNETVLVVYGSSGLRVYDWTEEIVWDFSNQLGEVSECFLEPGIIYFTTSTGKLFVYDFFDGVKQLIFEYSKPTYSLNMLVYPENKVVTKKNQNSYKFLLVGDKRKIVVLQYSHKIGKNFMFK